MTELVNTWLYKYYKAIKDGEIQAGQDLTRELENLIEDFYSNEYEYNTHDADLRITFIETCVKLTKSPFYGQPFKLLLWQKALIEVAYSFKVKSIDTGAWVDRFQEVLLLISRKNGKTELIASLMLAEMILGKAGSDIICSGTDDGTADLAYQTIDAMRLFIDPKSVDTWRNQKGISCLMNGNHVFKLSDSTRQKEGRNIDYAGIDEVHSLQANSIFKSIQQSTSVKPSYKIWLFGSEGFVENGFLDEKRAEYTKIIYGEDNSEASKRKLPWLYTQDDDREIWDTDKNGVNKAWQKSSPSIGVVKKWSYLRDRVEEARASKSDRAYVLTKDFNIKVTTAESWLMTEDLNYIKTFDLNEFKGSVYLGGVDLAETTDLCSAKALFMRAGDKHKYIHSMYWIPESKLETADDTEAGALYSEWAKQGYIRICEGNEVDVSLVADWYAELYKKYGMRLYKCGFDQKFAKEFTKRMDVYGFDTELVYQSRYILSNPMKLVEADIGHQLINYNNNPIDKWCLLNTAVKTFDTGHILPVKVRGQHARKIDGTASLLDVYEIYRRYKTDFNQLIGVSS